MVLTHKRSRRVQHRLYVTQQLQSLLNMFAFVSFHCTQFLNRQLFKILRHRWRGNRIGRHERQRRKEERRWHSSTMSRHRMRCRNVRGRSGCCLLVTKKVQERILLSSSNRSFIWSCILVIVCQRLLLWLCGCNWSSEDVEPASWTCLLPLEPRSEKGFVDYYERESEVMEVTSSTVYGKCDRKVVFWSY